MGRKRTPRKIDLFKEDDEGPTEEADLDITLEDLRREQEKLMEDIMYGEEKR